MNDVIQYFMMMFSLRIGQHLMIIKNHEQVIKARENAVLTLNWDFILSKGVTVKGKFKRLYKHIELFSLRTVESNNDVKVFASSNLAYSLSMIKLKNSNSKLVYQEDGDFVSIIEFERSCGNNGYKTGFKLYKDEQLPEDEIVMVNGDETKLFKIYNMPSNLK